MLMLACLVAVYQNTFFQYRFLFPSAGLIAVGPILSIHQDISDWVYRNFTAAALVICILLTPQRLVQS